MVSVSYSFALMVISPYFLCAVILIILNCAQVPSTSPLIFLWVYLSISKVLWINSRRFLSRTRYFYGWLHNLYLVLFLIHHLVSLEIILPRLFLKISYIIFLYFYDQLTHDILLWSAWIFVFFDESFRMSIDLSIESVRIRIILRGWIYDLLIALRVLCEGDLCNDYFWGFYSFSN